MSCHQTHGWINHGIDVLAVIDWKPYLPIFSGWVSSHLFVIDSLVMDAIEPTWSSRFWGLKWARLKWPAHRVVICWETCSKSTPRNFVAQEIAMSAMPQTLILGSIVAEDPWPQHASRDWSRLIEDFNLDHDWPYSPSTLCCVDLV